MPRISAELLSQPVPFTSMADRQLIRDSATERQQILKSNETMLPLEEQKAKLGLEKAGIDLSDAKSQQRLRNDFIQATEANRLIGLGDLEGAAEVLTADGPEDRIGMVLAEKLKAGDTEGVSEVLAQLKDELQQNLSGLGGSGTSRVQSSFVGENGNMWIIDRRTGKPEDTGARASETLKLVTFADGSKGLVDVKGGDAGKPPAIIESTEQALSGAQSAARASETGTQQAQIDAIPVKAGAQREQTAIDAAPGNIEAAEARIDSMSDAITAINGAKEKIGFTTTGMLGWVNSLRPGSKRQDLEGYYTTIKGILGTDALEQMGKDSASGASGMGALNTEELRMIQSLVVSLDADASPERQVEALNQLNRHMLRQQKLAEVARAVNEGLIPKDQALPIVKREWLAIDKSRDETKGSKQGGVIRYDAQGNRIP